MTQPKIITLTTDFGEGGYYLGAMRGVLLSRCPQAQLIDITHKIASFSSMEASFVLKQVADYYPKGTVHLAVVDPGVGGIRKAILLERRGQWFVGPDNGTFTPFLDGARVFRIRESVGLPNPSKTFHGRDVFAPVAAALANGTPAEELAEPTTQVVRLHIPRPRPEGDALVGKVLFNDRFGNLITNIRRSDLDGMGSNLEIWVGTYRTRRMAETYEDAALGEILALVGSSGHLEVAVCQGSAAAHLGVGQGERVRIRSLAENVSQ